MRVALKKMLVFSVKASSFRQRRDVGSVGPIWRHDTEKFEGSSLRPNGCPQPPLRDCEMKQVTPGTFGSSKSLTQTLSLGDVNLKVVLTQARSSARARRETVSPLGKAVSFVSPMICRLAARQRPNSARPLWQVGESDGAFACRQATTRPPPTSTSEQ